MIELLIQLTPIALVDSLSMLPFSAVALAVLTTGASPYLHSSAFLLGVFLSYFAAGVGITLGLGDAIEWVSATAAHRFWNPQTIDYVLGMIIGALLLVFGARWASARRDKAEAKEQAYEEADRTGVVQAFLFGAVATIGGIWGALPYFAAIDLILKLDVDDLRAILALAYYNVAFIALSAGLVFVRAALGRRATPIFETINRFVSTWGPRSVIAALMLLGAVMLADGVGWLLGHPLIPTAGAAP